MRAMDDLHKMTNGAAPDHIIVSERIWDELEQTNGFEQIRYSDTRFGDVDYGYLGMRVWKSSALDGREQEFIVLTDGMFVRIFSL